MSAQDQRKPVIPFDANDVKLKTGERVKDLSLDRLIDLIFRKAATNPTGVTLSAAVQAAGPLREAQKAQRDTAQQEATRGNAGRAARFAEQVKAAVEAAPGIAATKVAAVIWQAIEMDTDAIKEAKATGKDWQSLDLKFARKNGKGDPYSTTYVLEQVREQRRAK